MAHKRRKDAAGPLDERPDETVGVGAVAEPLRENASMLRRVLREPVALGLVPLILFRPWLDGVTYPTANFYFVWGVVALGCVWLARMLTRGAEPRFKTGTALLGMFWLVGLLTMAGTVQYDATYRAVVIWAGYLFLFIALVNGVRTRTGITIVLAAFLTVVFAETAYSALHYRYILPMVREAVMQDPHLIRTRFGTDVASAELIHRLQVNRAFGSLLYPNALAAFLILSLPVAVMESVRAFVALHARVPVTADERPSRPALAGVTFAAWVSTALLAYVLTEFVGMFEFPVARGVVRYAVVQWAAEGGLSFAESRYVAVCLLTMGLLPLLVAAGVAVVMRARGLHGVGLALRVTLLPLLVALELFVLWLTFSRGGVLAIVGATALIVLLMIAARVKSVSSSRRASIAAGVLLLALAPVLIGQVQPPAEPAPAVAQDAAPAPLQITKEGMDLTAADLANPASFRLRLTYWQTGLKMALDNLWTGVGLGNFGTVYPNYKSPTAGEVKAAHNDYLQALCETGLLGFMAFAAFWAYLMGWGALRIYRERDRGDRWALIGLYGGLLAFLAHSLVDFNFFNPALSFFAFVAAGLFVSRAHLGAEPVAEKTRAINQAVALPLLLVAALVCGMGLRVYLSDLIVGGYRLFAVGDDQTLEQHFIDGQFFFPPAADAAGARKPRAIPARYLGGLVPHRGVLESIGTFRVRGEQPGTTLAIPSGEPVPPRALFVLNDIAKAEQEVLPYAEAWLGQLRRADSLYPHNPNLAAHFMKWYDLLVFALPDGEARRRYTLEYVKWAQETVRRSPREFQYYTGLGKAMWLRANIEPDVAARQRYFLDGIDAYKKAVELFPSSPETARAYGQALIKYGQAVQQEAAQINAQPGDGARLVKEGQEMLKRAGDLEKAAGRV